MVDLSFGLDTWKMLFSPKLNTGTRGDPVCTAILTNPCTDLPIVVSCTTFSPTTMQRQEQQEIAAGMKKHLECGVQQFLIIIAIQAGPS